MTGSAQIRPEISRWMREMQVLFGNPQSPLGAVGFVKFADWHLDPANKFITRWRKDEPEWCRHLEIGVLGHAHQSGAAALYHADNILRMEHAAIEMGRRIVPFIEPGGGVASPMCKVDFEYQALELGYARSFEHLTLGLNAFFKDRSHDFENFGRTLRHRKHPVAQALADVYDKYRPRFEHTFSGNGTVSLRSRIMHREAVQAGTLNVRSDGRIAFYGGGHNLNLSTGGQAPGP